MPRRRAGPRLAAAAGLLALAAGLTAMAALDPRSFPPSSDLGRRLQAHVSYLASRELAGRKPGTPGHRAAAEYLAAQFGEVGLAPLASLGGFRQPVGAALGDNLIGLRPSASGGGRMLLLGAHYDHLGDAYLGADDNASSVAILLEVARRLPALAHHTVLFVAFTAEEAPYIRTKEMGSQYFADHLPPEVGALGNLQAVVIMDLMGGVHWEPLRDTIFAAGAEQAPGLYRRLQESVRGQGVAVRGEDRPDASAPLPPPSPPSPLAVLPVGLHLVEEIPLVGRVPFSDYDAFRNAGVPFLFLSAGRTPRYHQPTDLPDTLHYERMAATVRWLVALLARLDQDREPYRVEPGRIEFADEVAALRPLARLAAGWDTRIPGTSWLSLFKLRRDADWLGTLDPAKAGPEDVRRLERLSIRMQCLLADFPACFLI